jgi:hypothetical protein
MNQHGMSERRACKTMGCCRMTIRYETARSDDRDLRERMKALAQELKPVTTSRDNRGSFLGGDIIPIKRNSD